VFKYSLTYVCVKTLWFCTTGTNRHTSDSDQLNNLRAVSSVLRYFSFNQNAKKWWWLGELRQERDKDHDIA
ncbi:MAG TPA: hypothetical protein VFY68_17955, partial [Nitrososphaeraceae archaeon]|nr:hypothetical protein [Nitrososphaeraceae archaeon]